MGSALRDGLAMGTTRFREGAAFVVGAAVGAAAVAGASAAAVSMQRSGVRRGKMCDASGSNAINEEGRVAADTALFC